ncbi:MAG TPA: hypothetical protein VH084_08695 [Mycobacterium sp.]|nr:hypothetical protein [Mycobacterium sp.]
MKPSSELRSATTLTGYCGKSATGSYWLAMSMVVIPALVGSAR